MLLQYAVPPVTRNVQENQGAAIWNVISRMAAVCHLANVIVILILSNTPRKRMTIFSDNQKGS